MADLRHLILIRPCGELAIKSRQTRRRFQRGLVAALQDALASTGGDYRLRDEWNRLFVEAENPGAAAAVSRVFGIASISEVEATAEPRLDAIVETGARVYTDRVRGGTFAVRARRAGRHSFSSRDVNYELGAALNRYAEVDLDRPDVSVYVEVREGRAYFFSRKIPGPGGFPLGVEGRAVALLSGGYDSAVAAWMLLRRGVTLSYVFCNLGGSAYERAVLNVAKLLADGWSYGSRPDIHVIDFEDVVRQLKGGVEERYWQVVLKRLMYRAGAAVAAEIGAHAIVTGESVGQVSSQTLANLRSIEECVTIPVLRPLIGFDKQEIIARSREIGTYTLSEKVREYCALTEEHPVTGATPEQVAAAEDGLDLSIVDRAVTGRRALDLRGLDSADLVMPYLYTAEVPDGSVVIDTRDRQEYDRWHYPGSEHRDFWELYSDSDSLDRDRSYVLYCDLGLRTAQLAEKLQGSGYEAYSFKGGVRGLRQWLEKNAVTTD
ncbi:MAG: tRNA 4-thiouridine(8) synthase ThiI [Gemmatimonadetes bacterium]|uniref:tRNA sulfurtransferase n=1 Tax=Candidatus Kutchimonas denitrificans TaxID=3056748 RepID=A0AAE4Z8P4_9BACT|nr:tRNA 4-thiouridine(8) synthase ThiI [Gemmatimonadota bacterium]NIR75713.1 tRNA 4-thiouridine(8) synthase ThiI [Candidatus Kutchimonas denitrificans]NIS00326.1 tRNA 4-thiouridine(8) synthase ThiI [Gemmatimonadota bacterium]NIT65985.1 tRNA 4-thiouridine(8) synthase ThiI [Gemmatimonadota bacterium]NIU53689.1 tRNA 4-thiouridine(8) synthase ThiI [Gemmatimonadota bacterium]